MKNIKSLIAVFALASVAALTPDYLTAADNVDIDGLVPGDKLSDGTIYGGETFAVSSKDAPGVHTWLRALESCWDLEEAGHEDWRLPSNEELKQMYENRNAGSFSGTFNQSGHDPEGYYWSGDIKSYNYRSIYLQRNFQNNYTALVGVNMDGSARCVHDLPKKGTALSLK